jgi:hypothetical protein
MFRNSPLTPKDIENAQKIFGLSMPCIKGKWTRGRPDAMRLDYVSIPLELVSTNKYDTIAANVMFVSGLPVLVTLSGGYNMLQCNFCRGKQLES